MIYLLPHYVCRALYGYRRRMSEHRPFGLELIPTSQPVSYFPYVAISLMYVYCVGLGCYVAGVATAPQFTEKPFDV